jgi:trigger factor
MKVHVEQAGACRKVLQIQVPVEAVTEEYRKVAGEFAKIVKIPGFRPGRAPQDIVERRFAKDILEETRERLVPQAYHRALDEQQIKPVAIVDVSDIQLERDLPLSFRVTVDVAPEFALPPYKGIRLTSRKSEVTDEEVDRVVAGLRERHARYEDIAGRPAQKGDIVQVDFTGTCEGEPLAKLAADHPELGQAHDFWVALDEPEFLPGMAKGLEGVVVGEQRSISVTFPAEFTVKSVAGKQALYAVTAKALRERKLPELDATLFKALGVESSDDLRSKVRENLQKAAEATEKGRLKDEIVKWLVLQADLKELPQTLVEEEARHIIRDVVQENTRRGVTKEELEAHREDIFSRAAQSSADRVRMGYLLTRIAEEEHLEVSDEDVEQELAAMAARYGIPVARLRAGLEERGGLDGVRRNLRMEKTLDVLLQAAVVEVE